MTGDPSAPHRALVAVLASLLIGAGGAVFARVVGLPIWFGFAGAGAGTLGASALFGRWVRRRTAPGKGADGEPAARQAREALEIRRLWETARDFDAGGWGRRDLDALQLVSLNLAPGEPLSARVAERLRAAASAVRAGVTERLAAAATTAAAIGLAPDAAELLRGAAETLDAELARGACRAGEPVPFEPARVADAAHLAVSACSALREELRPRVVCSPADALRRAVDAALARGPRHATGRPPGGAVIDLKATPLPLVAVLPSDLLEALAGTLTRALARGRLVGPLSVATESASDALDVRIAWAVEDRDALDPSGTLAPLRPLEAYGAEAGVRESIENNALEIMLRLPRYVARDERGSGAELAGSAG
ncbi:MAG: hypothetical protein MUF27_06140 [Acidobacteria bacterium]|nr:hypothetical protein [Acidobacteriota bacterium]